MFCETVVSAPSAIRFCVVVPGLLSVVKLPSCEGTLVIFIDYYLDLGSTFSLVTLPVGKLDAISDSVELFCGLTNESVLPAIVFLCALPLNLTRSMLV